LRYRPRSTIVHSTSRTETLPASRDKRHGVSDTRKSCFLSSAGYGRISPALRLCSCLSCHGACYPRFLTAHCTVFKTLSRWGYCTQIQTFHGLTVSRDVEISETASTLSLLHPDTHPDLTPKSPKQDGSLELLIARYVSCSRLSKLVASERLKPLAPGKFCTRDTCTVHLRCLVCHLRDYHLVSTFPNPSPVLKTGSWRTRVSTI